MLARGTPGWLLLPWVVGIAGLRRGASPGPLLLLAAAAAATSLFRDPPRDRSSGSVVAAADGIVKAVEPLPDGRTRIVTFMSLLDVHVNRAPVDGVIGSLVRQRGGFAPAFRREAERNERVVWRIESDGALFEVVQIAGALARRIVPYRTPGQRVAQGERIGLIRFGSRVDVYLPAGLQPNVRVGQRLVAGESALVDA